MPSSTVLDKLANALGISGEVPNQELAKELSNTRNSKDISILVENLKNKNKSISHDCIKTLYELGYIDPSLISEYADQFAEQLSSKQNRMVWGAMIALSTISAVVPLKVFKYFSQIIESMEKGSVITIDAGVISLSRMAATKKELHDEIFPLLIERLKICPSKQVPQYAEKTLIAVNKECKNEFAKVINDRIDEFTPPQLKRIQKVLKTIEKL